jgi:sigma-54 specific flagellar transcriptional regulator A
MNCLTRNRWPGNVRELSNLLERLAILFPEQAVTADDLPERYRNGGAADWADGGVRIVAPLTAGPPEPAYAAPIAPVQIEESLESLKILESSIDLKDGIDLKDHLSTIEIGLIRQALEEADGTVAEAARLLKIRRTTLVEKLRKYRLSA